jgi:hypothetical protein
MYGVLLLFEIGWCIIVAIQLFFIYTTASTDSMHDLFYALHFLWLKPMSLKVQLYKW